MRNIHIIAKMFALKLLKEAAGRVVDIDPQESGGSTYFAGYSGDEDTKLINPGEFARPGELEEFVNILNIKQSQKPALLEYFQKNMALIDQAIQAIMEQELSSGKQLIPDEYREKYTSNIVKGIEQSAQEDLEKIEKEKLERLEKPKARLEETQENKGKKKPIKRMVGDPKKLTMKDLGGENVEPAIVVRKEPGKIKQEDFIQEINELPELREKYHQLLEHNKHTEPVTEEEIMLANKIYKANQNLMIVTLIESLTNVPVAQKAKLLAIFINKPYIEFLEFIRNMESEKGTKIAPFNVLQSFNENINEYIRSLERFDPEQYILLTYGDNKVLLEKDPYRFNYHPIPAPTIVNSSKEDILEYVNSSFAKNEFGEKIDNILMELQYPQVTAHNAELGMDNVLWLKLYSEYLSYLFKEDENKPKLIYMNVNLYGDVIEDHYFIYNQHKYIRLNYRKLSRLNIKPAELEIFIREKEKLRMERKKLKESERFEEEDLKHKKIK